MSEYDKVVWKPTAEGGKEGTLPLFEVLTVPGQTELWRKDKTIPLVDVVQVFEVFEHEAGGTEGVARRPSKGTLENNLGTDNVNDAIEKILTEGEIKHGGKAGKHTNPGVRNNSRGQGTTTGGKN